MGRFSGETSYPGKSSLYGSCTVCGVTRRDGRSDLREIAGVRERGPLETKSQGIHDEKKFDRTTVLVAAAVFADGHGGGAVAISRAVLLGVYGC